MIIKVAGVNGSGKTSLARAFMEHWPQPWEQVPLQEGKPKIAAYRHTIGRREPLADLFKHVVVLGDYRTVCGGMDTISDKEVRLAMVAKYAELSARGYLVFYEGLITGKTWGAMGALALSSRVHVPWLFVFMDTPFSVCVERVLGRRIAKGNDAPFDPERTMRPTYKSCQRVEEVAEGYKFPVHEPHYMHRPTKQVVELEQAIRSAVRDWGNPGIKKTQQALARNEQARASNAKRLAGLGGK